MAHLISFTTAKFEISKETPNPINPIAGQSVLNWLREELSMAKYLSTEPDTEDWGWYMDVESGGDSYLVGASADAENSCLNVEWIVQVHKSRSLKEKLLGRNKITVDDPLFTLIESIIRVDDKIEDVTVDKDA
jgi:hypothetical protein